jgi:hypothetical protein
MKLTLKSFLIQEARRNPTLNPKAGNLLKQLKEVAAKYGMDNIFVRYTNEPKLGHNPHFAFNTPMGISAYPLQLAIDRAGDVPWAADAHEIVVFTTDPDANIWDIQKTNLREMTPRIVNATQDILDVPAPTKPITDPKSLWYYMYGHVRNLADNQGLTARKILRRAGLDGVVDNGSGTIHGNEPTQALFFNTRALKLIKIISRFENVLSSPEKALEWWRASGMRSNDDIGGEKVSLLKSFRRFTAHPEKIAAQVANIALQQRAGSYDIRRMIEPSEVQTLAQNGLNVDLYKQSTSSRY